MEHKLESVDGYRKCLRCHKPVLEYSAVPAPRRYCSKKCGLAHRRHMQHIRRTLRKLKAMTLEELKPIQRMRLKRYTKEVAEWEALNTKENIYARQGE